MRARLSLRLADYAVARDQDVWGEDAALFKPERWIAEDGTLRSFDQWKCAFAGNLIDLTP